MSAEDLNSPQMKALNSMRRVFNSQDGVGLPMDDSTYLRYLRARNWDAEKAITMLNATIVWRHDFGLRELHGTQWKETIAHENSTGKLYVRGHDKQGHVIICLKPALENSKSHEGNLKHLVYNLERAIAVMETTFGQEKVIMLIDYDGFSLANSPSMATSLAVLHILQDHYPERLHRAYVVRPPYLFYALLQFLTPFMDAVTRSKAVMLTDAQLASSDNQMLKDIPCDQLEFTTSGDRKEADHRNFNSKLYLAGDFNKDFLQLLTEAEDKEKENKNGEEHTKQAQEKKQRKWAEWNTSCWCMAVLPQLYVPIGQGHRLHYLLDLRPRLAAQAQSLIDAPSRGASSLRLPLLFLPLLLSVRRGWSRGNGRNFQSNRALSLAIPSLLFPIAWYTIDSLG